MQLLLVAPAVPCTGGGCEERAELEARIRQLKRTNWGLRLDVHRLERVVWPCLDAPPTRSSCCGGGELYGPLQTP